MRHFRKQPRFEQFLHACEILQELYGNLAGGYLQVDPVQAGPARKEIRNLHAEVVEQGLTRVCPLFASCFWPVVSPARVMLARSLLRSAFLTQSATRSLACPGSGRSGF